LTTPKSRATIPPAFPPHFHKKLLFRFWTLACELLGRLFGLASRKCFLPPLDVYKLSMFYRCALLCSAFPFDKKRSPHFTSPLITAFICRPFFFGSIFVCSQCLPPFRRALLSTFGAVTPALFSVACIPRWRPPPQSTTLSGVRGSPP